jgi:hypothetical protein
MCVLVYSCFGKNPLTRSWLTIHLSRWGVTLIYMFTRMLGKAARKGFITGFLSSLYPMGVISLQYADATLLFLDHRYNSTCHLKWLMVCFEELLGIDEDQLS